TAREWNDQIVFLHRVAAGAADRSYGIQVARLAGLPDPVVKRAQELLGRLAVDHGAGPPKPPAEPPPDAAPLFAAAAPPHPAVEGLRSLDLDRLTPMDAFDALRRLRGLADEND
ncbi:MAG: DNA mismatch repair protein MutS, partial [Planctomycetota bacterium]